MIEFFKHILIAIVQGITEILPISSSAHIFILEKLLDMNESLLFSIMLHFGSLVAVIIYFHKELWKMIKYFFLFLFNRNRDEEARHYFMLDIYLIIATIPAALLGYFLNDFIETTLLGLLPIGIALLVTGTMLIIISRLNGSKSLKEMKWYHALIIGAFQGVGIVPGISRSGITLSGLKVNKFNNAEAAHFAFLLFIPVSLGSFVLELIKLGSGTVAFDNSLIAPYLVSILVAGVVTFFALYFLLKIIRKGRLWYFSPYLFLLGTVVIIWSCF
ncbi:MAG: undecaprenyl-diphosphate phosphatase [Erysipelotrichaceae bacterium]|jgi:undecaprenyl-diphosphatase|nr:undecaprenyl-diphosphate phosphatase [Erysipelotrichaceae bacterium]